MRSKVADALRDERVAREAAMTPSQRVALALALGRRDLQILASAQDLTPRQAALAARAASQVGRRTRAAPDDR